MRIKELRIEKNIEQKQLASDLGVTQPTISDWENNNKVPSGKRIEAIASYFNVSIDYLLGKTDIKNPLERSGDDITMNDIKYALYGEYRELSESDKQQLINLAKIARSLKEEGK